MVALLCFSCGHSNPPGARFCNACGAPLHLKPCAHCEAINARAAAHCHHCGEGFTFDFAAMDRPLADAVAEEAQGAPVEAPLRRSNPMVARIGALVAVIAAMVLLPAFLSHTEQEQERVDAAPPGALRPAATPAKDEGDAKSQRRSDAVAPAIGAVAMPPVSVPIAAGASRPNAPSDSRASTPTARATGAAPPPAGRGEARSRSGARRTATQHRAAAAATRLLGAKPRAPGDRLATTSPPTDTLPGRWQRPCSEGSVLDAGCDVRLLPKGN